MKKTTAKQIEAAKKLIEKTKATIETHTTQIDRALAKLGLTLEDFVVTEDKWSNKEFAMKSNLKDKYGFSVSYSIESKLENKARREKDLRDTEKRLAQLLEQAAIEDTGENERASRINPIIVVLEKELEPFKGEWIEKSLKSASKEFDFAMKNFYKFKEAKSIASNEYFEWLNFHHLEANYEERKTLLKGFYDDATEAFKSVSWVAAWKTEEDFLEKTRRDLITYWANSIERLADKLSELDVDLDKAEFHYPSMDNGINVVITDGKPRLIDARMIWAATYSTCVSEHIRYIVTTKKCK